MELRALTQGNVIRIVQSRAVSKHDTWLYFLESKPNYFLENNGCRTELSALYHSYSQFDKNVCVPSKVIVLCFVYFVSAMEHQYLDF